MKRNLLNLAAYAFVMSVFMISCMKSDEGSQQFDDQATTENRASSCSSLLGPKVDNTIIKYGPDKIGSVLKSAGVVSQAPAITCDMDFQLVNVCAKGEVVVSESKTFVDYWANGSGILESTGEEVKFELQYGFDNQSLEGRGILTLYTHSRQYDFDLGSPVINIFNKTADIVTTGVQDNGKSCSTEVLVSMDIQRLLSTNQFDPRKLSLKVIGFAL